MTTTTPEDVVTAGPAPTAPEILLAALLTAAATTVPAAYVAPRPFPFAELRILPRRTVIIDHQGDFWVRRTDGWRLVFADGNPLALLFPFMDFLGGGARVQSYPTKSETLMGLEPDEDGFGPFHVVGLETSGR